MKRKNKNQEMIKSFKKYEKIDISELKNGIDKLDEGLLKKLKDGLSIIIYKQKRKLKNLRITSLNGYIDKQKIKNHSTDLIYKTKVEVELSNFDTIIGRLYVYKDKQKNSIKISINDKIIYNIDNEEFNNNELINKIIYKYTEYLKVNWKIR